VKTKSLCKYSYKISKTWKIIAKSQHLAKIAVFVAIAENQGFCDFHDFVNRPYLFSLLMLKVREERCPCSAFSKTSNSL